MTFNPSRRRAGADSIPAQEKAKKMNAAQHNVKFAGLYYHKGRMMQEFVVENGAGDLIATMQQRTADAEVHRVCWYGITMHAVIELTSGGLPGAMATISARISERSDDQKST